MLICFTIENFKSFFGRAQLSMIAKRSDRTVRSALIESDAPSMAKQPLLSAAAIYGSNASGKTNFLLAMQFMRRAVLYSQTSWRPTRAIPVDVHLDRLDDPAEFEITFVAEEVKYRYGFVVDKQKFLKEWLFSYPKGRERELFVRTTEETAEEFSISIGVGSNLAGSKRDHESTARRVRQNSLFLSAAAQDNQDECTIVYGWFQKNLLSRTTMDISSTEKSITSMLAHDFDEFKCLLEPLIRLAEPSISEIIIKKLESENEDESDIVKRAQGYDVSFILKDGDKVITVNQERESRGVKRLYALATDLISCLKFGRVIIVDELETSMHAHVAGQILALFQNKASNPNGAQIVFTTHETRMLNLQHLRRDQIWFCERYGISSSLYPLTEFSPRKDDNFEAGYLRGKYGAVPLAAIDPKWIAAINNREILSDEQIVNG